MSQDATTHSLFVADLPLPKKKGKKSLRAERKEDVAKLKARREAKRKLFTTTRDEREALDPDRNFFTSSSSSSESDDDHGTGCLPSADVPVLPALGKARLMKLSRTKPARPFRVTVSDGTSLAVDPGSAASKRSGVSDKPDIKTASHDKAASLLAGRVSRRDRGKDPGM